MEIVSQFTNMPHHSIENAQEFDRHRASQWPSAKSCAMHSRMHAACGQVCRENRAERQSRSQRFRDGHNVRLDSVMLICEIMSSASEAALNFIYKQQSPGALTSDCLAVCRNSPA